jgi:hypothetical protein
MTDMQTSLPFLIVWSSILNLVINFSIRLWPVKWNALGYTFALRIPFHLLQCRCNTCTNQSPNDMIHFISSCDCIDLDFTSSSPLPQSIGTKSSLNLPFTLANSPSSQVLYWSSPPWSHDSMSCLICNELLHHMCEPCNISKSFHLYGMYCSHTCTCGLITCVSHSNTC